VDSYTIFGGFGFVGSELARQLEASGHKVLRVGRDNWPDKGANLGQVIFCIGMTADFRKRLIETFEIQLLRLYEALTNYRYESFLYLSSARIYSDAISTHEDSPLLVRPTTSDHIYNISKIAGESLCLAYDSPKIRVARLSNVYGMQDRSNLFMTAVMREAVEQGQVTIGQAPESSKDYIAVEDAAALLIAISKAGQMRLYNVACGSNFTHRQIADVLEKNGFKVHFKAEGSIVTFPKIDTTRAMCEFSLSPTTPALRLPDILNHLKQQPR
jgi:nucleoside-diphosphate-sugar epimerase